MNYKKDGRNTTISTGKKIKGSKANKQIDATGFAFTMASVGHGISSWRFCIFFCFDTHAITDLRDPNGRNEAI